MRTRVHVLVPVHERVRGAENLQTPLASEGCSQGQKIPFAPPRSADPCVSLFYVIDTGYSTVQWLLKKTIQIHAKFRKKMRPI